MNALKSVVCAGVVGAGLFAVPAQEAKAGGLYIGIGHGGYGHGHYGHGGLNGGYGHGGWGGGYGYGYGGHAWPNTSHFDYHPGYAVPHYGHFDYAPGHYDFYGSGHMHNYGH